MPVQSAAAAYWYEIRLTYAPHTKSIRANDQHQLRPPCPTVPHCANWPSDRLSKCFYDSAEQRRVEKSVRAARGVWVMRCRIQNTNVAQSPYPLCALSLSLLCHCSFNPLCRLSVSLYAFNQLTAQKVSLGARSFAKARKNFINFHLYDNGKFNFPCIVSDTLGHPLPLYPPLWKGVMAATMAVEMLMAIRTHTHTHTQTTVCFVYRGFFFVFDYLAMAQVRLPHPLQRTHTHTRKTTQLFAYLFTV